LYCINLCEANFHGKCYLVSPWADPALVRAVLQNSSELVQPKVTHLMPG